MNAGVQGTGGAAGDGGGDCRFLAVAMQVFLGMIRCGPQGVLTALDKGVGLGNPSDVAAEFGPPEAVERS